MLKLPQLLLVLTTLCWSASCEDPAERFINNVVSSWKADRAVGYLGLKNEGDPYLLRSPDGNKWCQVDGGAYVCQKTVVVPKGRQEVKRYATVVRIIDQFCLVLTVSNQSNLVAFRWTTDKAVPLLILLAEYYVMPLGEVKDGTVTSTVKGGRYSFMEFRFGEEGAIRAAQWTRIVQPEQQPISKPGPKQPETPIKGLWRPWMGMKVQYPAQQFIETVLAQSSADISAKRDSDVEKAHTYLKNASDQNYRLDGKRFCRVEDKAYICVAQNRKRYAIVRNINDRFVLIKALLTVRTKTAGPAATAFYMYTVVSYPLEKAELVPILIVQAELFVEPSGEIPDDSTGRNLVLIEGKEYRLNDKHYGTEGATKIMKIMSSAKRTNTLPPQRVTPVRSMFHLGPNGNRNRMPQKHSSFTRYPIPSSGQYLHRSVPAILPNVNAAKGRIYGRLPVYCQSHLMPQGPVGKMRSAVVRHQRMPYQDHSTRKLR